MYDDIGSRKEVPHWHTDDAHKILGVVLAPDNNNMSKKGCVRFQANLRIELEWGLFRVRMYFWPLTVLL